MMDTDKTLALYVFLDAIEMFALSNWRVVGCDELPRIVYLTQVYDDGTTGIVEWFYI